MSSPFYRVSTSVARFSPEERREFRDALTESNLLRMTWLLIGSTLLSAILIAINFFALRFSNTLLLWQTFDIVGSFAFLALFLLARRGAFPPIVRWWLGPVYYAFWLVLMLGYYFYSLALYGENITFAAGAVTPAVVILLPPRYFIPLLGTYYAVFLGIQVGSPTFYEGRSLEAITSSLVNGALAVIVGFLAAWFGYGARRTTFEKELLLVRRNAEIRRAESNLRAILENIPFQAWLKDREGRFLAVNEEFARAAALPKDDIIGVTAAEVYPAGRGSRYLEEDLALLRSAEKAHFEESVESPGGTIWFEVFKSPVLDDRGQCHGTAGIARDITSRRRMEDQLRAANAAKSEFLAAMSHEIRTPMNSVLGYANLLRDFPLEPAAREYVESIAASGEILLCVINDILDFSKIEAGQLRLVPMNFPLRPLLQRCLRSFTPQAAAKGLRLDLEIVEPVPEWLHADPLRLEQILINLLSNAVKFTDRGSVILRVQADPTLRFSVHDTGIGISQEQLERLFRPFSQADSAIARRFSGTGLGLVITQRLCQLMGGRVGVASEPGKGSTFTAFLPLTEVAGDPSPPAPALPVPAITPASLSVLVVEDNVSNRRLVEVVLRRHGVQATLVESGEEALRLTESTTFDLILMDIQMPGMDGFETTRLFRAQERLLDRPRARVVALTALAMTGDAERCLEAGMDDYLTKPLNPAELERTLRECAPRPADPT